MHGGPGDGGLRGETWLPLAQVRWATWSTTPPDPPASRGSATTTCWDRGASTSSPGALTLWRGSLSPPARCGASLPWPRRWRSPTAPSRQTSSTLGLRWLQDRSPDTERFFAVCWDGEVYQLVVPPQAGTETRLRRLPAPRRRGYRVPLPRKRPRLLLGHRRPGRAGVSNLRRRRAPQFAPRPELSLRVGRLRPLRPGGLVAGDLRAGSGRPAARARRLNRCKTSLAKPQGGEQEHALLPGQRIPAGQPVGHRGRLRRHRRLRGRGPLPPLPGAGGHYRPGRP